MKTKILLTAGLFLLVTLGMSSKDADKAASSDKTIRICTTPDTRSLVESWTMEYGKNNPEIDFEIKPQNFSEFNNEIDDSTLGFLIKRPNINLSDEKIWQMLVGRDVIVPAMNSQNPFAEKLIKQGVSVKELAGLIKAGKSYNWDSFVNTSPGAPVHFYILDKPEVQLSVSKFLNIDPVEIQSVETKPMGEILEIVRNDKYSIVFCRLADIVNWEKNEFIENVSLLPIDRNGNGQLDFNENIYTNLESFKRAIWIGKYPKSLIYNIYVVSATPPANETLTGFLSWIITSGQQMVEENGYSELVSTEVRSSLEKLTPVETFVDIQTPRNNTARVIIIGVVLFLLVPFIIVAFFNIKWKRGKRLAKDANFGKAFNEGTLDIPGGLLFDKTHTWVFMEKDGTIKVGVDDFLQHVTGNYTGIIMKEPGEKLAKNEPAVTLVKEGKKINIYSPVSGTIKEINEDLVDFPSLINTSPYSWGWIYTMAPSNWYREISFLKMADSYKEWIKKEFIRLKDFLTSVRDDQLPEGQVIYQEGGELQDHPLQQLGPKTWEDFQVRFIDTSDMN